jgi:hypothetical protein
VTLLRVVGGLAFVVVLLVGGWALYVVTNPESTECYAQFESPADADRAVEAAAEADFNETDREGPRLVVFKTGETGGDASAIREGFGAFVKTYGGRPGHAGDGCLEREAFGR